MWKRQCEWRVNNNKRYEGRWTRLKKKQDIQDSTKPQVWSSSEICFLVGPSPTEHPPKPFTIKITNSRQCRQRYARKRKKEKISALQERIKVNIMVLENRRRQIVRSVKKKGEGKLQLPSKRAPVGKIKCARYPYHHGKVVLFLPSN